MSHRRSAIVLTVAYDGTHLSGFALQKNARTVAGELQGAIAQMDPKASAVRGVSRTDSGVHARGQIVAFDTEADIDVRGWALGLAQHLSDEIAIVGAARADAGYDPRGHATRKTYSYKVLQSDVRDPLLRHHAWVVRERLNHDAMVAEAGGLLGEHDFRAFRGSKDTREETVRKLFRADIEKSIDDPRVTVIEIEGDRFLYRMVRIIVGALVDVGRERLDAGAIHRAIETGNRDDLGITAPAHGLTLERIELDDPGREHWPNQLRYH